MRPTTKPKTARPTTALKALAPSVFSFPYRAGLEGNHLQSECKNSVESIHEGNKDGSTTDTQYDKDGKAIRTKTVNPDGSFNESVLDPSNTSDMCH